MGEVLSQHPQRCKQRQHDQRGHEDPAGDAAHGGGPAQFAAHPDGTLETDEAASRLAAHSAGAR